MQAGKLIGYIVAAILLFFGVLWMWAAPANESPWLTLLTGIIMVGIALVIIIAIKLTEPKPEQKVEITTKLDLRGNMNLERLKCRSCGGDLSKKSIQVVSGGVLITCEYCGSTYMLEEEPKW
ncbi:MAG: hypothetical protein N3F63_02140 [Thermoplasmata archaeon]|nr:hypothetical protein [Thermoplasmata archaeon]